MEMGTRSTKNRHSLNVSGWSKTTNFHHFLHKTTVLTQIARKDSMRNIEWLKIAMFSFLFRIFLHKKNHLKHNPENFRIESPKKMVFGSIFLRSMLSVELKVHLLPDQAVAQLAINHQHQLPMVAHAPGGSQLEFLVEHNG